ncbi:MAG: hypothetical protein FKY71_11825 [Spiribacter salinus]|uniref:RiboL-PSP-HEPN domain-containing protein n=1 Tax=Spiribacter salinus TaxID=1335746 RepID=A0A540VQ09_9GAMM|nr:MAG: hypothetical protein FKY71_11825 [Spiribacter salinus]
MTSTTKIFSGQREVRTFADLAHAADVMIIKSEESLEGSYYTIMSALLLTAFTFEAYLNHLGEKRISFWSRIDSIRVMDKYSVLTTELEIAPDFSRRPCQTLKALFRFRNSMAHGRSEIVKVEKEVSADIDPYEHFPRSAWEEYCTLENAKRCKKDIDDIVQELHRAAGLGEFPYMHGIGTASVTSK